MLNVQLKNTVKMLYYILYYITLFYNDLYNKNIILLLIFTNIKTVQTVFNIVQMFIHEFFS